MHVQCVRLRVGDGKIEGVDDAAVEPEIAAQLVHHVIENPAVAAVAVDDDEITRRQRAYDFPGKIAQQGDEILDAERERAGRSLP